jgi:hypothetical protein
MARAADREFSGCLRLRALCVAEIVEPIQQFLLGHIVAAADFERPREHPRQHAIAFAVEARVDHPRKRHVVVTGEAAGEEEKAAERQGSVKRRLRVSPRHAAGAIAKRREQRVRARIPAFRRRHQSVSTQWWAGSSGSSCMSLWTSAGP